MANVAATGLAEAKASMAPCGDGVEWRLAGPLGLAYTAFFAAPLLLLFAISFYDDADLTRITGDWAFGELFLPQALRGVSLMLCMIPINVLALGTLPPDRLKNASGLFNLTRNLGGAFGLALINTSLASRTDLHAARLADHVAWGSAVAEEELAGMVASLQPVLMSDAETGALARLRGLVTQQATVMAFADIFLLIAVLFAAMILLVFLIEKPRDGAGAAGH